VNHPEYPSAHSFSTTAVTDSIARFFGTNKVTWTLTANKDVFPQLVMTAVLYLDEGVELVEHERINWDSTVYEPLILMIGIGRFLAGTAPTVLTDELRLAESRPEAHRDALVSHYQGWGGAMVLDANGSALAYAKTKRARSMSELKAFIRFPSISAQPRYTEDFKKCAAWLVNHLRQIGPEQSVNVKCLFGGEEEIEGSNLMRLLGTKQRRIRGRCLRFIRYHSVA
jgi:hypothetical protein